MLYQIFSFLLDIAIGVLGGACLLRAYMQRQRISFSNPVGRFIFALTDWVVLPLRRVIPSFAGWDMASLLAAFLLSLLEQALLYLLADSSMKPALVPVLALFGLARLAISGLTGLVIVYAILSWFPSQSPLSDIVGRLCEPLLRPFRRLIPLLGGIDLSPLALLILLQVGAIVLANVLRQVLLAV
ncbi:MAG: YggT family protein [Burkholderiales bacterium]